MFDSLWRFIFSLSLDINASTSTTEFRMHVFCFILSHLHSANGGCNVRTSSVKILCFTPTPFQCVGFVLLPVSSFSSSNLGTFGSCRFYETVLLGIEHWWDVNRFPTPSAHLFMFAYRRFYSCRLNALWQHLPVFQAAATAIRLTFQALQST